MWMETIIIMHTNTVPCCHPPCRLSQSRQTPQQILVPGLRPKGHRVVDSVLQGGHKHEAMNPLQSCRKTKFSLPSPHGPHETAVVYSTVSRKGLTRRQQARQWGGQEFERGVSTWSWTKDFLAAKREGLGTHSTDCPNWQRLLCGQ